MSNGACAPAKSQSVLALREGFGPPHFLEVDPAWLRAFGSADWRLGGWGLFGVGADGFAVGRGRTGAAAAWVSWASRACRVLGEVGVATAALSAPEYRRPSGRHDVRRRTSDLLAEG